MSNSSPVSSDLFSIRYDQDIVICAPADKAFLNAQAQEFNRLFDELRGRGIKKFILDFSTCDYISSEGLNITAQCWKLARDDGLSLVTVVPGDPKNEVREMFDLIGLSKMIVDSLKPTVLEAILALREGPPA